MTGISWMLQEAGECPNSDYVIYDNHEGEEDDDGSGSGEFDSMDEYEYTYDVHSEKAFVSMEQWNKTHKKNIYEFHKNLFTLSGVLLMLDRCFSVQQHFHHAQLGAVA